MNFSGIPYNSFWGRLWRLALELIPSDMTVPVLQGRLRGKRWVVGSSNHGCWLGSYEWRKRVIFESFVKEGSVVFDLGAHVGFYSLLSSFLVGPSGSVFAFEPLHRNLFYLKKHIKLNNISNITIIEAAVSDFSGCTSFCEAPKSSMSHMSSEGKLRVRTVKIDDLIAEGELPVPDLIKVDIEGSEMLAFLGAKLLLSNAHPTLFLSTHGPTVHKECCHFLKSIGYRLSAIGTKDIYNTDEILAYYE